MLTSCIFEDCQQGFPDDWSKNYIVLSKEDNKIHDVTSACVHDESNRS